MIPSRRAILAGAVSGTVVLTAGCVDFVTGEGSLELAAERAAPTDNALESTDYEEYEIGRETIDESVDVGVERDVEATIWVSSYAKEIEFRGREHDGCFFTAVSIPDVSLAGYSANPIEEMSNEELLTEFRDKFAGEYDGLEDLTHTDSLGLDVLGDSREVDVFEGETEFKGEAIDIELQVSSFSHEDDLLVLLGSYPVAFAEESANVEALLESVEHPV